jgi:peroxiredoxin
MKIRIAALCAAALVATTLAMAAKEPEIGKTAPSFGLKDVDGQKRSLQDFKGKYVVLEWVNHGCPFVKKHYDSGNMQALQKELTGQGAVWLSICSSAEGKQGNMTPAEWKTALAEKKVAATATLLDPEGTVGKTYGAKTTPHMYLIGPDGKLLYKGAIDDRPSTDKADVNGAKNYVRAAFLEAKEGKPVSESDTQAYGCSVKYK